MMMCIQNLVKFCPFILQIWSKNLILESIKGRNSVANLRKNNDLLANLQQTLILSMMMCIQNLVLFCQFVLKILSKDQILTSIKGHNSVANLRKTKIYNINLDLVTDNVYTNFGLILSIRSQDIKQKTNFNQGPNSLANLRKTTIYNTKADLVDDNVFTNLVLIGLFVLKILNKNSVKGSNSVAEIRTHPSFHACPRYLQE